MSESPADAARLDSSLEPSEARKVHESLRSGRLKLLYVAPERLAGERFVASLAGRKIALLAVDEAHCISEWGHDFRPDYLELQVLHERWPDVPRIALTATATPAISDVTTNRFRRSRRTSTPSDAAGSAPIAIAFSTLACDIR